MCSAFVYVHAFHGCERACGAQPVTREGVARRDNTFLEKRGGGEHVARVVVKCFCVAQPDQEPVGERLGGDAQRSTLLIPRADALRGAWPVEGNQRGPGGH